MCHWPPCCSPTGRTAAATSPIPATKTTCSTQARTSQSRAWNRIMRLTPGKTAPHSTRDTPKKATERPPSSTAGTQIAITGQTERPPSSKAGTHLSKPTHLSSLLFRNSPCLWHYHTGRRHSRLCLQTVPLPRSDQAVSEAILDLTPSILNHKIPRP